MGRIRTIKPESWKRDCEVWGHGKGNLYVVQEGRAGPVKVGIAGHPVRRFAKLQCGNPRALYLRAVFEGEPSDCAEIEKAAHRFFAGRAIRGEWLRVALPDVLAFVSAFEAEQ